MDLFLLVSCFILMLAVLYLLLSRKINHSTERIFREHYKTQFRQDMTEFYREMESYAVLFDNKIQQFKKLMDRQNDQLEVWKNILDNIKTTQKAKKIIKEVNSMIETKITTDQPRPPKRTENKSVMAEPQVATDPGPVNKKEKNDLIAALVLDDMITNETNREKTTEPFPKETQEKKKRSSHLPQSRPKTGKEVPESSGEGQPIPPKKAGAVRVPHELETDDLLLLLQDLSDSKKKPKALQVLLEHGYKISEIADMSDIPFSDLETTKNIYGLNSGKPLRYT